eukprot:c4966_g1_i1.p1 GENE.c4966_g1_i1~~c4966_g1_i1.p1  ORF type:complete len:308 (-),score=95.13 c4966_g1_i1:20-943(-)
MQLWLGLFVCVFAVCCEGLLQDDSSDLLPEHPESTDMVTLMGLYSSKIDGTTSVSKLLDDMRRVKGRSTRFHQKPQPRDIDLTPKIVNPVTPLVLKVAGAEALDVPQSKSVQAIQPQPQPQPPVKAEEVEVQSTAETEPHHPNGYEFECHSSRDYSLPQFNVSELVTLQSEVCQGETSSQWNTKRPADRCQEDLQFIVETSNFAESLFTRSAALGVRMYVLQPFDNCNRRTAACAAINAIHNGNYVFREGVKFWDVKAQFDGLEGDGKLGHWDEQAHQFQFISASSETKAINQLSEWLEKHTTIRVE